MIRTFVLIIGKLSPTVIAIPPDTAYLFTLYLNMVLFTLYMCVYAVFCFWCAFMSPHSDLLETNVVLLYGSIALLCVKNFTIWFVFKCKQSIQEIHPLGIDYFKKILLWVL